MGYEIPGQIVGQFPADVDMSTVGVWQYAAVGLGTAQHVDASETGGSALVPMSAGFPFVGILQNNPVQGEAGTLMLNGFSKCIAGATYAAGTPLVPNSSGAMIAASGGAPAVGLAAQSAVQGDISTIYLLPTALASTTISGSSGSGAAGESAYQLAVDNGYQGTLQQWLVSLHGAPGTAGLNGKDGSPGAIGAAGESAYQQAVDAGFSGTMAQWLQSLKGSAGAAGAQGAQGVAGPSGQAGAQGGIGPSGESAYQEAVDNGFSGTMAQWLASLKGVQGESAYQVAVDNGYTGTQQQWLQTLVGPQGPQGQQGQQGQQGPAGTSTSSSSSGSTAAATPILDSIGILYLNGTSGSGYYDFQVPGDASQSTFRFKMPYDGWVLGFSIYGSISPAQNPGYYVSKKDLSGNYTDIIHVDSSVVPSSDLSEGYTYYSPTPPKLAAGEMFAMKLNNQQQATYDISAFVHIQYDPTSVNSLASIQSATATTPTPGSNDTSSSTPTTPEGDVALLDLGSFYADANAAPTSAMQLQDLYIDSSDGSAKSVNNSRFAPFNCNVTSYSATLQNYNSVTCTIQVMTQGGNFTITIPPNTAHVENTLSANSISVPMGGYFYATISCDSAQSGDKIALNLLLTLTPA